MLVLHVLILTIFLYFWNVYHKKQSIYHKFAKQVGGPRGYPIIGNALEFMKNLDRTLATISDFVDQCGDRFIFFFGPSPVLVLSNAEDLEKVHTSTDLITKSVEYDMIKDFLGNGLILSTGQHWLHRRKLITPCFHFAILEKFISPSNAQAEILVNILKEHFIGNEGFKDICPFMQRCALDIICETSMGIQLNSQVESKNEYVEAVNRMGELFQYRSIRPWLRIDPLWKLTSAGQEEMKCLKIIHSFTDQVVADRKKSMKSTDNDNVDDSEYPGKRKKALLDMLLEAQQTDELGISDEGISEETTTFIFAGHDTVSVSTSFCLYNLGNHPDIQKKVHQELDSIFGNDLTRPVTSSDLKRMKYLELCIKESLRLFPSVPFYGRLVDKPFQLDEDTVIPAGVNVYVFSYKLHRNPKYYPKAEEYIPERFDMENNEHSKTIRSPFVYLPFSAGQRNCIGQKLAMLEVKIMLANVLRNFKVTSEKKGSELELLSEFVLRVKGGLKVKLESRFT